VGTIHHPVVIESNNDEELVQSNVLLSKGAEGRTAVRPGIRADLFAKVFAAVATGISEAAWRKSNMALRKTKSDEDHTDEKAPEVQPAWRRRLQRHPSYAKSTVPAIPGTRPYRHLLSAATLLLRPALTHSKAWGEFGYHPCERSYRSSQCAPGYSPCDARSLCAARTAREARVPGRSTGRLEVPFLLEPASPLIPLRTRCQALA
jgi:hypothetical protein